MQYTHLQIETMLHGAYKKLKSYYYYDKTLLFMKKKIADLEWDDTRFHQIFGELADAIISEDIEYFNELIKDIDFFVFPKNLASTNTSEAIVGAADHHKNIHKVNFFINAPIELLILDCLWTLYLAKISSCKYKESTCSYAGKFKSSLFINDNDDLYGGIDFESNRCFEPYFKNYSRWQEDAFTVLHEGIDTHNQIMFSLDIKSFYYSVRFKFDMLNELLADDTRLAEINFITTIEEKIYKAYTQLIIKYKKGINIKKDSNETIFPIGLLSPIVLRELYLFKFDSNIENILNPTHYGRYVDDMIIVIPSEVDAGQVTSKYICKFLMEKGLIEKQSSSEKSDFKFKDFDTISIQQDKITCFFFEKNASNALIELAEKQISRKSSEANLLPEFDVIKSNFNDIAYFYNSVGGSTKIRDIGILQSNNYAASRSITSIKHLIKNTNITGDYKNKITLYINDLLRFYSGSSSIEFMSSWISVLELIIQFKILSNDHSSPNRFAVAFKNNILDYIKNELSFDILDDSEIFEKKKNTIFNRLKKNLKERLSTAIAIAMALDYRWVTTSQRALKSIELAKKFRKSNMFNHNLVSFPMINYLPYEQIASRSLIEIQNDPWECMDNMILDQQRLYWSPRYIHLDELFIYHFMQLTQKSDTKNFEISNINKVWKRYVDINKVSRFASPSIGIHSCERNQYSNIDIVNIFVTSKHFKQCYVGLANTTVTEEDALQSLLYPKYKMTIGDKEDLFKMANAAVKGAANFIAFPEFFVPAVWLKDLTRFAQKNDVTIIAGLRYIRSSNQTGSRAYNCTTIIQPFINNGFSNSIALFREKNFYAPKEKEYLYKLGYIVEDPERPTYYIVHSDNIRYSSILCFEFTDIFSRACLKSKIDVLFVPQLNKDTSYFSSIVESASRDLHCFIVQANTSHFGDSRVTGPYNTTNKNIVQIKGGINNAVIIGELKINELKDSRVKYENNRNLVRKHCFNCNVLNKSAKPYEFEQCKQCKHFKRCEHKTEKLDVKDSPANFK